MSEVEELRENKRGKWIHHGKFMVINLENAREQYSVLGYPHRNIEREECSVCGKYTMKDDSIRYDYCPHCGAKMEAED